ncbi:MAG: glycosyltransferase family 39 protein [Anaerolineales bacterium]|nr:glycosyltransferase family 39 protein [Anaerolineales bacterium]
MVVAGWRSPFFYVILTVYLLAGVVFATLTPNWQAPDEPAHFNYVHFLSIQSGFPELVSRCYNQAYLERLKSQRFPPELPLDTVCYEFHQPPLYYLLATPVFIVSGGSLLALRLFSVILGAGVVGLAYLIALTIFPGRMAIAYGTMAFVGFVPMHVAMLASVNNDALAELILAGLLLLLIRRLGSQGRASTRCDITLGVLLGLGLITKTTVYIAVPLTAVALGLAAVEEARRRRGGEVDGLSPSRGGEFQQTQRCPNRVNWSLLIKQTGLIFGLALVIGLPWYIRNAVLYGNFDLLGLGRHDAVVVGQLRTNDYMAEVGWPSYLFNFVTVTFQSFWGQFGWMAVPMSRRVYLALTLLTLAALGGVVGFWTARPTGVDLSLGKDVSSPHAPRPTQFQALLLMVLTIGLMLLGYVWYNLEFVQFQGRYLFPALIPLGIFLTVGLQIAFSPRWAWLLAGGLALALGWLVITSLWRGEIDKLALLLVGLALALALGRAWLASRWPVPASWLLTAVYAGLAGLTLLSPFWYVIPYLSP